MMERQLVDDNDNNRPRKAVVALSITQIVIGITVVLIGTVQKIYNGPMTFLYAAIWNGLFFMITGTVCLVAEISNKSYLITTSRTLRILSASIFTPILIFFVCFALAINDRCLRQDECLEIPKHLAKTDVALNSLLLLLAVANIVISIITYGSCINRLFGQRSTNTAVAYLASGTREMGHHPSTAPATDSSVFMAPLYGYQVTASPVVQQYQCVYLQPVVFQSTELPLPTYRPQNMENEMSGRGSHVTTIQG